jgi:predicted lipoprotein with Yx(FWY)xxD motif
MRQKFGWLAGALAMTVALAACGGSDDNSSKVSSNTTTTTEAPAATTTTSAATTTSIATTTTAPAAATVKAGTVSAGNIVVSADGKTLYAYMPDGTGTTSMCTGGCAGVWPPLMASGTPVAGPGLDASKLSAAPSGQVIYGGHLLYGYTGDTAPGQANGQGLANIWHVVSVSGDIIT